MNDKKDITLKDKDNEIDTEQTVTKSSIDKITLKRKDKDERNLQE